MVWRTLTSERAGDMQYDLQILEAGTGTDQSRESDDASQAAEDFEHQFISGVCHRRIHEGDRHYWQLENIWDNVDINHITLAPNFE